MNSRSASMAHMSSPYPGGYNDCNNDNNDNDCHDHDNDNDCHDQHNTFLSTFLYDNNSCCQNRTYCKDIAESSKRTFCAGNSVARTSDVQCIDNVCIQPSESATKVHDWRSLCLRGSANNKGTVSTVVNTVTVATEHPRLISRYDSAGILVSPRETETDMHAGIVWLKSRTQRSRCAPFAVPAC